MLGIAVVHTCLDNREVIKRCRELQEREPLDSFEFAIKWVDPELMHLTLKFAGDVPDRDLYELCEIVDQVVARYNRFEFGIKDLGVFGSPARVGWIGIDSPGELLEMQKELGAALSLAGLSVEDNKGFHGHLTLCRVKNFRAGKELSQAIYEYGPVDIGTQAADTVCVYSSELTKAGPEYAVVSSSKLK